MLTMPVESENIGCAHVLDNVERGSRRRRGRGEHGNNQPQAASTPEEGRERDEGSPVRRKEDVVDRDRAVGGAPDRIVTDELLNLLRVCAELDVAQPRAFRPGDEGDDSDDNDDYAEPAGDSRMSDDVQAAYGTTVPSGRQSALLLVLTLAATLVSARFVRKR